ncbi:MAG TPA: amidohydrolase family protein, partial [Longimicrobium sp.]
GRTVPDQDVVVTRARIGAVGRSGTVELPRGARVVDASGKYLIPGLWDMHVHTVGRGVADDFAAVLVANGITGIRDLGDDLDALQAFRSAASSRRIVAPRVVVGGRIHGPGPRPAFALPAETAEQGRAAVDSFARAGAQMIKVYESVSPAVHRAIIDAARSRGLPVTGHVPASVSAVEAIAQGQAGIEHEDDLVLGCTAGEMQHKARIAAAARTGDRRVIGAIMRGVARDIRADYDEAACSRLITSLARGRVWVTPTLVVYVPHSRGFDSSVTQNVHLKYVPASLRAAWAERASERTPDDSVAVRSFFSPALTLRMHRAGVRLMAGTDAPLPYVIPGFSLHEELRLLVAAGLSPAEALRTATLNPALALAAADSTGTIEPGKLADLVVLDRNPLTDIRATEAIFAVVVNGTLLERAALDALLDKAEKQSRGTAGPSGTECC